MTNKEYDNNEVRFPSEDEIFGWIQALSSLPHRRTGTEEGLKSAEYIKEQFEDIGLEQVKIEEIDGLCLDMEDAQLSVNGKSYSGFMINGTFHKDEYGDFETGKEYENCPFIYLGEGRDEDFEGIDVKGKIVMCDCPWFDMDEDSYAKDWCSGQAIVYDPDAEKRTKVRKTDSYSPNAWPYNYIIAQKKGAVGFVGILNDYFEDGILWSEDYTEIGEALGCSRFKIPGIWIGVTAADEIKKQLAQNKNTATVDAKARYYKGKARNVFGVLPGKSADAIVVHSHHDAVFSGAVQDASGMSEVLALAKYFSHIPKEKREKTLIFAGLDGHYTDYAGHRGFVKKLSQGTRKILADVVIEHIGKDVGIDENNRPIVNEYPEIRLLYVSDNDKLVKLVEKAVVENRIKRTIIMPVKPYRKPESGLYEFQQDEVISDAYYSHIAGIPIVSILSPQMYLFHPMDKPDMIPKDQLVPVGEAFVEIIKGIGEIY